MPFWFSVILVLIAMAYFSHYYEGVALFFISDLLYGVSEARYMGIFFIATIISVIFIVSIEILKKKMRVSK
jgi:succinate dehydrogenase/fumarate reductase cytochrome b subunit